MRDVLDNIKSLYVKSLYWLVSLTSQYGSKLG